MLLMVLLAGGHVQAQNSGGDTAAHYKLYSVLYQRKAAEYRALCYQAYTLAERRLKEEILIAKKRNPKRKLAIITDLDETALDNSDYYAEQLLLGREYDGESWKAFTALGKAKAVPGAVSFFKTADLNKVRIAYLSNRKTDELVGTLANLRALGFPQADSAHLLLKTTTSSKEERRRSLQAQGYEVLLLLGDNLNDFEQEFEKQDMATRAATTDRKQALFGRRYIVLPNAIYGEWEDALTDYKRLEGAERKAKLKQNLQ